MMKLDDWLIVNPGVQLHLIKKFNVSRITIYRIWKRALESFTNGVSESYKPLFWKQYKSGLVQVSNIVLMILS